jgi:hypothetical protein
MNRYHRCEKCLENPCPILTEVIDGIVYSSSMAYCGDCWKVIKVIDNGDGTITICYGVYPNEKV